MSVRLGKLLEFYEQDKNDTFVRYGIALEYRALKDYDEALKWLQKLRRDFTDYLPTYYQLGELYQLLGDLDNARSTFEEGVRIARTARDLHTASELQAALDEVENEI